MAGIRVDLKEWDERGPENEANLRGLALNVSPMVRASLTALEKSGALVITELRTGVRIQTTSFVGRIQLGELLITVKPKIPFPSLLRLFRYAYGLRDLTLLHHTEQHTSLDAFQDLLIDQLATEVTELVSRGLHKSYERLHEDLISPRGRIDMHQLALRGGTLRSALPCSHYPRLENTLVNQVILQGLMLAATLTNDIHLRTRVRRLATLLEDSVSQISLNYTVLRDACRTVNRLTASYQPALKLIQMLMFGQGVTLHEEEILLASVRGFFFDMNRFFEQLIARFLTEYLGNYEVIVQHRLRDIMSYASGYNPQRRRPPTPRPDYAIAKNDKVVALLDAKYRDLWEKPVTRDILYQLSVYALSQTINSQAPSSATILYPTVGREATEQQIDIKDPMHGGVRGRVMLRPVNLVKLEELLTAEHTQENIRRRERFAAHLVFGDSLDRRLAMRITKP